MKKHVRLLTLLLAFSVAPLGAQSEHPATVNAQSSTTVQPPPVTTVLKKTVGLLRVQFVTEHGPAETDGTCFFVFYEDKRGGDNFGFIYLVTNRHMAQPGIEEGKHNQVLQTMLRLNPRNAANPSEEGVLPIDGQHLQWFFPVDDSVDLAVLPILPDREKFDYVPIPVSLFATQQTVEEQHIAEGEKILFAGYFYQFPGEKKFQPIVREGILAMIPDEKLDTTLKKPGHLYLGDLHVFGGNSGSPLFINLGGFRNGSIFGGDQYKILGIVSGFYHEDSNLRLTVATTLNGTLEQNSGIAMIVPVDELKALLETPSLQSARDAQIAAKNAKK